MPQDGYRISSLVPAPPPRRPHWVVRAWRAVFGRLVYTGPETCGHCKHWVDRKHPRGVEWKDKHGKTHYALGDCKLLYGNYDKTYKDTCDGEHNRFQVKRRFKHRVRGPK